MISGAIVGAIVWCRHPHYRLEGDSYSHFKAMLISLSLHLILLMFELLACDQLTTKRHLWVLVFIPLIFGSVASVGACVWSVKHDRSYELELFMAVNALQFVFLPLKLDAFVSWTWEVVFVPLWIVLCLSLVGELHFFFVSCQFMAILGLICHPDKLTYFGISGESCWTDQQASIHSEPLIFEFHFPTSHHLYSLQFPFDSRGSVQCDILYDFIANAGSVARTTEDGHQFSYR